MLYIIVACSSLFEIIIDLLNTQFHEKRNVEIGTWIVYALKEWSTSTWKWKVNVTTRYHSSYKNEKSME